MGYIGLSREEAIRKHRKLWGWIAAETRRLKRKVIRIIRTAVHICQKGDWKNAAATAEIIAGLKERKP